MILQRYYHDASVLAIWPIQRRYLYMKIHLHIIPLALSNAILFGAPLSAEAAELTFTGTSLKPIAITPERSTGLDKIYVLYTVGNASVSIPVNTSDVTWYRYSSRGGGFAEEVESTVQNGISTLTELEGDMGYIIEDGTDRYYFWVMEYEPKRFKTGPIELSGDSDCDATLLTFHGDAQPLVYYTITGQRKVLSREIEVHYSNLEWNDTDISYDQKTELMTLESIEGNIRIVPPLYCQTTVTLSGDRFLSEWNWEESETSNVFQPNAVGCHTSATQATAPESDLESNIISSDSSELGGSAPAEITFNSYVTDAVMHDEWQMSRDSDFDNIEYRFYTRDLDYTFYDEGTYYLRYVASNSDGSCEAYSDIYTVTIGDSQLLCPNAFSPNGDGTNDIWRVAYRSLIEFKCWIFDRYGRQIYYYDNPDGGWDGKIGNKTAPSGVYYYVIQATGADNKKYKKSGDINIINYVGGTSSSSGGNNPE